ncbi:cation-transporting P-type ATPase [Rhizobium sp. 268]|nr:hypothetical protein [Rhizobium leguminosarum bv. viciae]
MQYGPNVLPKPEATSCAAAFLRHLRSPPIWSLPAA